MRSACGQPRTAPRAVLTLENLPELSYHNAGEVAEHLTTLGPDALSGETSEAA